MEAMSKSPVADRSSLCVDELDPCQFPGLGGSTDAPKRPMALKVNLENLLKLQQLCDSDPANLPSILRVAWGLLLRCYTGLDNVCFGYQETGARAAGNECRQLDGMALVRFTADDTMSVADRIGHEKEPRSSGRRKFDTAVVLRSFSNTTASNTTSAFSQALNVVLPEECKLRLIVKHLNGNLTVFMEWLSCHMSSDHARNVASTFAKIVSIILLEPGTLIGQLDLFSQRNREQVAKWNSVAPEKVERCIHEVIQDQAQKRPASDAVCSWDGNLTYQGLDRIATRLAVRLVQLGVEPEDRIPLCFEKSKWTVVAMLAVMKAGGAFVPLDPSHPTPRLQALAQSVGAKLLLCSRRYAGLLAAVSETVFPIDQDFVDQLPFSQSTPIGRAKSDNAAYLIFTSGSTGEPKGTVVDHVAFCSGAKAHVPRLRIDEGCRVLQFSAHTFDSSLAEILSPLMYGATVCIPSEDARLNNLVGAINELEVNHATLTPSVVGFVEPAAVPRLKTLILAGEAMSQSHIATWSKINLINAYGPTEASVAAVINNRVTPEADRRDIGFPVGVRCWITDSSDNNRLVPVGCIGELLLEGPSLARGYLNNAEKTSDSFIFDPTWSQEGADVTSNRRFYKTGDLVRYNSDQGSLSYVGRKDTQVKFHGQRIELGEIEHHLNLDASTKHCLVMLPKTGYYRNRLLTVLSLSDTLSSDTVQTKTPLTIVDGAAKDANIAKIQEGISSRLPVYMVPTTWLCVNVVPMLTSGKLDRKSVTKWVENVTSDLSQSAASDQKSIRPASERENQLRMICSHVLNLPATQVALDRSFLKLGGDSITAMTFMGQAKKRGIGLKVDQILRSKSLQQLAACAVEVDGIIKHHVTGGGPFDLSPIQQLHFQVRTEGQGYFNQSFLLRLTRKVLETNLKRAIEIIVGRHSMLRARFSQSTPDGEWKQQITEQVATSYRFRLHTFTVKEQIKAAIADSQAYLNAIDGPVLTVDLFNINDEEQILSLIGHHLVIDLVSWRVILEEMEELLLDPTKIAPEADQSLPYQTWCSLQAEHCQRLSAERVLPIVNVPNADFAYWGMEGKANTYGDAACEGFEVDTATTSRILTECHHSLRTEIVDILLAALLHSFRQAFTDRHVPPVYNEGHGREPFDSTIDITRTVGWFTVICPIFVPSSASDDLVETIKLVKDFRHGVPANGRPYFASRFLTKWGKEQFGNHYPMELTFNYLGQYQQLERDGALLEPYEALAGEAHEGGGMADFGFNTPRFGLFEISAVVVQGKLRFSFTFNRYMRHQQTIREWISYCRQNLYDAPDRLTSMEPQATLTDYPLLPLTHESLKTMETEKLPQIGLTSFAAVEDVYPCSPIQQGLLLSRSKDESYYAVQCTYEVKARRQDVVDLERLASAWQKVVRRHAALRTVFADGLRSEGVFDQVVLKSVTYDIIRMRCDEDTDVLPLLDEQKSMRPDNRRPPHRFFICETSAGKAFCRLEISHAIMDGVSMSIMFRDLALAYADQLSDDSEPPLYRSFIAFLQDQPHDIGINYWKSYLTDVEPCHFPILNDGVPATKQIHSLEILFDEYPQLQSFCDSGGLTLSNAFYMAWSLTLRSYCDSEETCFGYLTSGRDASIPGVDAAVGPFINMLACRATMPGAASLIEALHHMQQDYLKSLPYSHTPLAEVQHALSLSGVALFNTCLSYQKRSTSVDSPDAPITFSEHAPIHDPTEYPVSINIETSDQGVAMELDYWTDALSEGQATNVASTFIQALRNIVHYSDHAIADLDYLGDHMMKQVWMWNREVPEVIDDCVHEVIERQATMRPEAEAICAWDGTFSYAQLNEKSGRLATYLIGLGIGPEALVPTCFDKSAWTIIAMLAVLKAGGACVPLDATHPKNALETRVIDTEAQVVLASPERAHIFDDMVPYVVPVNPYLLDQLPAVSGGARTTVKSSSPSFVVFTSGSTGKPKGVILEHRATVTSADAHGSVLGIGTQSRVLQFAAYTFDNSLEEIFTTLMRGGCVCVPSDHDRFNNLTGIINTLNANFMDLTPTVASLIQPSDVPNVKTLAVGGEALTKKVVEIWGKSVPVHNLYGPSECSINSTHNGQAGTSGDVSNIGRCVGSISWVVDSSDHNRLVPIGCPGELLIEGPILARGYLNDSEKTAKSFIEDPLWVTSRFNSSGCFPRRMYKTGDLVRYISDGSLQYLGRKDGQIKLNGQRIELGEIEYHVKTCLPDSGRSAVELVTTVNTAQHATKSLAAFLCLTMDAAGPSASQDACILPMSEAARSAAKKIETTLSALLPGHMVPSMYIPISYMPSTSSQKLDRRTLRIMAHSLSEEQAATYRLGGTSGRAPSTKMEKDLQELFAIVLKVSVASVGADDSFFRRGGDSIGAMRLVTAAHSKGIHLTVANVFQTPKLSQLASGASSLAPQCPAVAQQKLPPFSLVKSTTSVDELRQEVAFLCQVRIESVQDIYPCSSMQEGLVALSNRQPGAYVAQVNYPLPSDIDVPRFRKAWQDVVDTEVVLRTRIVFSDILGSLQVVVGGPITWESARDPEEVDRQLFPEDGGSLCRYTIVGEGTRAPHFIWTAHHALFDGWSLPILISRVESRYQDFLTPIQDNFPSYSKFIEYLSGVSSDQSDQFWETRLGESTSPQFPQLPHPSHEIQATSLLTHVAHVSMPLEMEMTMPSFVRCAWALVVGLYSNSDDVVFGEILTGRDAPVAGIEDMIGPTLTTVPTRICIDRDLSIAEFLKDSQKQLTAAIPYQFAGLQHIRRLSSEAARTSNFQNLLAVSHASIDSENGFWNMASSGSVGSTFYTYPLNVSCSVDDGKVTMNAHYDPAVLPEWQVSRLLDQFDHILLRFTMNEHSSEKIGDMELLSPQDRTNVTKWNREPLRHVDKCIHHIFQERVQEQPNAIAVCSWDGEFTFQQLDRAATNLTGHLLDLGIGPEPETFVLLCFEKSAFAIIAMLAVLKAGAAFVPIDPSHPIIRLQQIVDDSAASLVLCSSRYQAICETIAAKTVAVDEQILQRFPQHCVQQPFCAASSAAYVIFTSGTTGKPKGTIVEHFAFCSSAMAHGPALSIKPRSRVLQFASYVFDASLVEILTTLMIGACVCVPNDYDRINNIAGAINQMQIDVALLTPSVAQWIEPSDVPRLRTLILAGEAMSRNHVSAWADNVNLVNGYGPSECSVTAAICPRMTHSTNPANIGHRLDRCWIVDAQNHDRLAPIGSVGELLVEGPTLARGYLNEPEKTAKLFIENPKWSMNRQFQYPDNLSPRRMYKTGDLVKICSDETGEMVFLGRKDAQGKLNGQRFELDEVEHHLNADSAVQRALVALMKTSSHATRLVAVLSLRELASSAVTDSLEVIVADAASHVLAGVEERLRDQLPAYMVPSKWVVLRQLPVQLSGKLDRRRIVGFVDDTKDELDAKTFSVQDGGSTSQISSSRERQLQTIWSQALNLPLQRIAFNQSFLHLGGDSISAMQVMARCRSEGMGVSVQDIIRSKSISDLATRVTLPAQITYEGEDAHEFDLSPIQQLYFDNVGDHWAHFNQSVLLRSSRKISPEDITTAFNAILKAHSMLRARFRKDGTGHWKQRLTTEVAASYRFRTHNVATPARMKSRMEESQRSLDIQKGPLVAVDLFPAASSCTQLFISVHHLVVDLASWPIILQDLEDCIIDPMFEPQISLPFQAWCRRQVENAQQQNPALVLPHQEMFVADLEYWGMKDMPNAYGDVTTQGLKLDSGTTKLLLEECHHSLNTDPLDVLLAVMLWSFRLAFPSRETLPPIYNEGHGREPWETELDLSRTVGWFTTLCPVSLPTEACTDNDDFLAAIRWVKDFRRRLPEKGRPYFAYRLLTSEGRDHFGGHWPMELAFNYLGQMERSERRNSLLQPVSADQSINTLSDVGNEVPRFALIEISAAVIQDCMEISFSYNKHMQHQSNIATWAMECQNLLQRAPGALMQRKAQPTLSDFPLLPLAYHGLEKLVEKLPELGISSLEEVEDIYPCSPMQRGIFLGQLKDPGNYAYQSVFEVRSAQKNGQPLEVDRLERAWEGVVQRHATLRTIFVDSVGQEGLVDQLVVRQPNARVIRLECCDGDAQSVLADIPPLEPTNKQPPHRLSLCRTTTGRIFCRLEMSHVISDGSSMPILLRDLAEAYTGTIQEGRAEPRYSSYISHIQAIPRGEGLKYWKKYLAGVEPCLFPSLVDGAVRPARALGSHVLKLERESELQDFCDDSGMTLANVLQLVWALVLRCYTGSDEVCFGYVASGRDMPVEGIEDAVGAFINMLICRINLENSLELGEALDKVQVDFVNSMVHQTCSLAEVQRELNLSGTSLFNTVFTYQRRSELPAVSDKVLLYDFLEARDPSEYHVAVNVEARDSSIEIDFAYWTDNLSHAQAKNVAITFEQVLKSLVSGKREERTIKDLDFFSEYSRAQVCHWNRKPPLKVEKCVHTLIEQQASLRPLSTPAVCGWDACFTYNELEAATTRLANHLVGFGVGPEVYVPLCFEKSAWAIVAQLGVMKAGGAFVPLDPSHPESRLRYLIEDVGARLVLCSPKQREKVSRVAKTALVVDRNAINRLPNLPMTKTWASAVPSNPAYVIFTSGTTGHPKGTVIEHASICTNVAGHSKAIFMRANSRVLQFASYTFDACIMEILWTLLLGGCVCTPSDEDRMNDLPGVIKKMNVNWAILTPSVASTLSPEKVPTLKVIAIGGEALSVDHMEKWVDKVALVNCYGPTETAVLATISVKSDERGQKPNEDHSTIGTAHAGRSWIVDPWNHHRLAPIGAVGELVIEGPVVARGYLNDEKKTAEAFVKNLGWMRDCGISVLFSGQECTYRTGDLVRYNCDGTICYLSRKDAQIKLNGQRIELGEIEYHCKQSLPSGAQCAVELVMLDRAVTAKALAVFFSLPTNEVERKRVQSESAMMNELLLPMDDSISAPAKHLRTSLAQILPNHMIPQFFVPVSQMPWLSSGKLDRKRLHEVFQAFSKGSTAQYRGSASKTKVRSCTEMEKRLQRLWEKTLQCGTDTVAVEDNFVHLGGDSLAAIKLAGAARSQNIALSVANVLRKPILSEMAKTCEVVLEGGEPAELRPFSMVQSSERTEQILQEAADQCRIQRDSIQDMYPTSSLQESLITLTVKQAGAYVAQTVFRLSPSVDLDRFKSAWEKTVHDVDTLRTRIVNNATSTFLQLVLREDPIVWHTGDDLHALSGITQQIPAYTGAPLTRYTIVHDKRSSDRYFVWSIHHSLYDGWSFPLVLRRVQSAYLGETPVQPKCSYAGFIQYLQKKDAQASESWWRGRLASASSIAFPRTLHASSDQVSKTRTLPHRAKVSRKDISPDITVATIIRAAWANLVAAYTMSDDVVFGETLAGRDIDVPGIADVVGPTLTTVPTRVQINRDSTVAQFLRQVHEMAVEMIPYQHLGLQHIKRLDKDTAIACDFQNLLVIQTAEEQHGQSLWDVQDSGPAGNFFTYPLVVECGTTDNEIEIMTYYDENLMSTWLVEKLLYQFEAVLTQLSAASNSNNDIKLGEIDVFSHEDYRTVQRWNDKKPDTVDQCIHDLIKQRAISQPSAPAIHAWDSDLTYQETCEYATRLALHLVTLGVGPEVVVPICMDKCAWTVVAILAVLFAGGALCPLDPTHSFSLHQELLEELEADLLLCSPSYDGRFAGLVEKQVVVNMDMILSIPQIYRPSQLSCRASSDNTAYVIFTSGDTGRPNGVVIEHSAFCSGSIACGKATLMSSSSRVLHVASMASDTALMEILTTLMFGGCVCVPTEDERLKDKTGAMHKMAVTWAFLESSVVNMIEPSAVPSLEVLACSKETMSTETIARWADHVKLMNVYASTATTVFALVNPNSSVDRDPVCIGQRTAALGTWIVDPADYTRLAPVGAVGELVLDGPALARHFLKNPEKTGEAFVDRPAWTSRFTNSPTRIYKTGDLVRYNRDGAIDFIGRKDEQVELNGQRVGLGDIEGHLYSDSRVRHALVMVPESGPCKRRLVAVLSLSNLHPPSSALTAATCVVVEEAARVQQARKEITDIKLRLSNVLPQYMIPEAWMAVEDIPRQVSGKLDRRHVATWVTSLDEETCERIMEIGNKVDSDADVKGTAKILQDIWACVLNLPIETVNPNRSFLSLGGDSMTAMGVVARCHKEKLSLSLHDVFKSKSIHQLALQIESVHQAPQFDRRRIEEPFSLSPIQRMYFRSAISHGAQARFNQSCCLRITRNLDSSQVNDAIGFIIASHSMLRVRFCRDEIGGWQQLISKDVASSYRYRTHHVDSVDDIPRLIAIAQSSLDFQHGPIFAADLFNVRDDDQIIFLTAHHLCMDVASWRIILQDIQEYLKVGSFNVEKSISFQTWCAMQESESLERSPNILLPFEVVPANLAYWGMEGERNTYADADIKTFAADEAVTALALGACHETLQTEPLDLFLSIIAHSFSRTFTDRASPTLYNESDGRMHLDIDLSRTVGWFTSICPLHVPVDLGGGTRDDVLDTLKHIKDTRRRIPENGRLYFAQQCLSFNGQSTSGNTPGNAQIPMEVVFNYLGRRRHPEPTYSLFQPIELAENGMYSHMMGDTGPNTTRFALFEITAVVIDSKLQFSFAYNRHVQHARQVSQWIAECERTLEETVQRLAYSRREPTLSDYPLMSMNYDELQKLVRLSFPEIGVQHCEQVENVYPCSPVQEGILLSQLRDPDTYLSYGTFEAKQFPVGSELEAKKMSKAWQKVLNRHAALRTVFIDSVRRGEAFDQVVLKDVHSGVVSVLCNDDELEASLDSISLKKMNYKKQPRLQHQMTICTTFSGRMFLKLEINHAVIDGFSIPILFRDLGLAYEGRLEEGSGPLYSDYIHYVRSQVLGEDLAFWKSYLMGVQPSYFPQLNDTASTQRGYSSIKLDFNRFPELLSLCESSDITLSNVMHAAWGLVLRKYLGSDDVCFGYVTAGRDAPVNGVQDAVGVFINMLCCRIRFAPTSTLAGVFCTVRDEYLEGLPYQRCSLAQVQHELGLAGKSLYNTSLSVQNHGHSSDARKAAVTFEPTEGHDPSEYAVTVNVETARHDEGVVLNYGSKVMSDRQATELACTMAQILEDFISRSDETIAELDTRIEPNDKQNAAVEYTENMGARAGSTEKLVTRADSIENEVIRQAHAHSRSPTMHSYRSVEQNQLVPEQRSLDHSPALRSLVTDCVQEVIERMVRSGVLRGGSSEYTSDLFSQQESLPLNDISESDSTPAQNKASELECYDTIAHETDSQPSMAAKRSSRRGRSAIMKKKLLAAWSSMLEIPEESISSEDSFFEMGGDSIIAMKLVGVVRDHGLTLTVADVFRHPTFAEMAAIMQVGSVMSTYITDADLHAYNDYNSRTHAVGKRPESESYERFSLIKASNVDTFLHSSICPKVGVFKGGIADVLPVTDFQSLAITGSLLESRWMLNYFFLDGSGPLNLKLLKQTCFRLVQAFEILRTVFLPSGDRFLQVVLRKLRPDFQVVETEQDLDEFTATLQARDRRQGPRLGEPFVQFVVAKAKDSDRHRILIRISHAQYDGVCMPNIMAALQSGYQGDHIPEAPSFARYVRATAKLVTSDHYTYWRKLLQGSSMTDIVQRQRPNCRGTAGATMNLSKGVRLPAVAHGNITIATVVKAAWALVLAQLSARSDVVFGHTISGRNTTVPGVENIVGPCLNVVPVRIRFEAGWKALDLLRHVQDQQVANMPYEALGFREITKHCTEWPNWTNFTTTVQHQNVGRGREILLGDNNYKVAGVGADEDFSDFSIVSTPLEEDDMVEIRLGIPLNGPITKDFAEQVLSMLTNTAASFAANPSTTTIPTPTELCGLPCQTVEDILIESDDAVQSKELQQLPRAELLVLSDILSRAWRQVLRDEKGESSEEKLQVTSSFFDLGGDIVGLAQVAWQLEQEGFQIRVEDLIDHPTILGHMGVLRAHAASTKSKIDVTDLSCSPTNSNQEFHDREPVMLSQAGRSQSIGQAAVGLAKRMVKRRTKPAQSPR